MAAFLQGLQEAGWEVGRNLRIETRWSGGDPARLRKNAADLVALNPDVIMAGSGPTLPAMLQATRTVPIVFAQAIDPVGSGSVREPGAAGRQRHRLPPVRIRPERKMAGAAQGDRTAGQACGRAAGIRYQRLGRTVGRDPGVSHVRPGWS